MQKYSTNYLDIPQFSDNNIVLNYPSNVPQKLQQLYPLVI